MHGLWFMAPFRPLLANPNLWSIRRRTVVPAFAIGLFVAFIPVPGHMLIAALLAIALNINIPTASLATLLVNPITLAPIYYVCYQVGQELLGLPPQPFDIELSLSWLGDQFLRIWQPLLLGCLLFGSLVSFIGYVSLDLLWRASIADYLTKRRAKKAARLAEHDE